MVVAIGTICFDIKKKIVYCSQCVMGDIPPLFIAWSLVNHRDNFTLQVTWVWRCVVNFYLSIYLWFYSPLLGLGPWPLFSFLNYTQSAGLLGRGDQPVARPLPIHRTTQTQNKRTQTSMRRVGLEPTTPVFERAKTVHALVCSATVIGVVNYCLTKNINNLNGSGRVLH
jgi:hypothetical protein